MPQFLRVLFDPEVETPGGDPKPEVPADDPEDKPAGEETDKSKTADDVARLKKALESERQLREAAEKKLKAEAKAKEAATKSVEERLAEMEAKNRKLELKGSVNAAVDEAIAGVEKTHEVNRADVMELLDEMNVTEENYEAKVALAVKRSKQLKKAETDHETTTPRADRKEVKIDPKNPPRIADIDW